MFDVFLLTRAAPNLNFALAAYCSNSRAPKPSQTRLILLNSATLHMTDSIYSIALSDMTVVQLDSNALITEEQSARNQRLLVTSTLRHQRA